MPVRQSSSSESMRDNFERSSANSTIPETPESNSTANSNQEVFHSGSTSETNSLDNCVEFHLTKNRSENCEIAKLSGEESSSLGESVFFPKHSPKDEHKLERRSSVTEIASSKKSGALLRANSAYGENGKYHLPKSLSACSLPASSGREETFSSNDRFKRVKPSPLAILNNTDLDSASTSPKQDSNHKHSQVLSDAMKNLDKQSEQPFRKKKRSPSWYSVLLSSSYKQKNDGFHKCFKQLPEAERLLVDSSCALMKDILVQGRMYVSQNYVCFHSNILRWQTNIVIKFTDIEQITKERTVKVFPNAIQFQIKGKEKASTFTSFTQRDRTFQQICKLWKNALADKPMTAQEMWSNVRSNYGADLGCSSDEDYVKPDAPPNDAISYGSKSKRKKKQKITSILKNESNETLPRQDDNESSPKPYRYSEEDKCSVQASENELSGLFFNDGNRNESCPDVNYNVEDDGPSKPVKEDLRREYLLQKFDVSAESLQDIIFGEGSDFLLKYLEGKGSTDVVVRKWKKGDDENEGNQVREISYNLALNTPFLPKYSGVKETQIWCKESVPGRCYAVDCIAQTSGIPYCDYFSSTMRYAIRKLSNSSCELKVTTSIKYHKTPWGLVKNFIEKNVHNGMESNFSLFERQVSLHLSQMQSRRPQSLPVPLKKPPTARPEKPQSSSTSTASESSTPKRNDVSSADNLQTATVSTAPDHNPLNFRADPPNNTACDKPYPHKGEIASGKWFFRILCMLFVLLLWSNYTMYHRISALEKLYPSIPKNVVDYNQGYTINNYDGVNSDYFNEPSSKTLQLLNRRLAILEDLLRNLTISSDRKWMSINNEWKELHQSVSKLVQSVESNKRQASVKPT